MWKKGEEENENKKTMRLDNKKREVTNKQIQKDI